MTKKNRQYILYGILGLVALAIIIGLSSFSPIRGKAYVFSGNLTAMDGNMLAMQGRFTVEGDDGSSPTEPVMVTAYVDSGAVINRTAIELPSSEELEKTGGRFNVDDLKQVTATVALSELQNDAKMSAIGLTVKSTRNIFGKKEFTVTEVNYRMAR